MGVIGVRDGADVLFPEKSDDSDDYRYRFLDFVLSGTCSTSCSILQLK